MAASGEVLQMMMENANWNNFLIAAEQGLNESLKAGIGNLLPGYTIIQAFDWFEIGRKFTEEKPGFVLLDTELSGVDTARFIHTVKEDPFFGKPNVFLLTNDSSVIQADAVFSKPLDLSKLEAVMKDLEKQLDMAVTA